MSLWNTPAGSVHNPFIDDPGLRQRLRDALTPERCAEIRAEVAIEMVEINRRWTTEPSFEALHTPIR